MSEDKKKQTRGPNRHLARESAIEALYAWHNGGNDSAMIPAILADRIKQEERQAQDVEYFRGSSSEAIAGTHLRDVVFMQPSNGVNGYYFVMDHVSTDNADDTINVA